MTMITILNRIQSTTIVSSNNNNNNSMGDIEWF